MLLGDLACIPLGYASCRVPCGSGDIVTDPNLYGQPTFGAPVGSHVAGLLFATAASKALDVRVSSADNGRMLGNSNDVAVDYAADLALVAEIAAVPTILEVVCRTTGMGFAAVARVTEDRWIACGVRDEIEFGLQPGGELKVQTTICNEIRSSREVVLIDDVSEDGAYCSHPTPAMYGFRSYVSMPIILPDGSFFGTLCAIDPRPARVKTAAVSGMFELFAELIAFHVDAHHKLRDTAARLDDQRLDGELREQFIAVLGHDLRNPLASIDAGVRIIAKDQLSERSRKAVGLVEGSVRRMTGLINDVLDFARGRMGGGIPVEPVEDAPLAAVLHQVTDELAAGYPDRVIDSELDGVGSLRCDPGRLAQMLSNLVANALTHGFLDGPIRVRGKRVDGFLELSVSNPGKPIPPEIAQSLFKPFVRNGAKPSAQGLGLGLYISSEIAVAHGGTLVARSSSDETTFTFRMPA